MTKRKPGWYEQRPRPEQPAPKHREAAINGHRNAGRGLGGDRPGNSGTPSSAEARAAARTDPFENLKQCPSCLAVYPSDDCPNCGEKAGYQIVSRDPQTGEILSRETGFVSQEHAERVMNNDALPPLGNQSVEPGGGKKRDYIWAPEIQEKINRNRKQEMELEFPTI